MVFAPLTVDASESTLREALRHLDGSSLPAVELADIKTAMALMAGADKRKRGFNDVLKDLIKQEDIMSSTFFDDPFFKPILDRKVKEKLQEVREQEREETVAMMTRLLSHRLGRELTDEERRVVAERLASEGSEAFVPLVLDGHVDELNAWLRSEQG